MMINITDPSPETKGAANPNPAPMYLLTDARLSWQDKAEVSFGPVRGRGLCFIVSLVDKTATAQERANCNQVINEIKAWVQHQTGWLSSPFKGLSGRASPFVQSQGDCYLMIELWGADKFARDYVWVLQGRFDLMVDATSYNLYLTKDAKCSR